MNKYNTPSDHDVDDEVEESTNLCSCLNCPSTAIDLSKCCLTETKIRNECQKENVGCVLKLKKIDKLWDKVKF